MRLSRSSHNPVRLAPSVALLLYVVVCHNHGAQAQELGNLSWPKDMYDVTDGRLSYGAAQQACYDLASSDPKGGCLATIPNIFWEYQAVNVLQNSAWDVQTDEFVECDFVNGVERCKAINFCNSDWYDEEFLETYLSDYQISPENYETQQEYDEFIAGVIQAITTHEEVWVNVSDFPTSPYYLKEWNAYIGLTVNDVANSDSWKWASHPDQAMKTIPYEYSNWFATEPDHVNAASGVPSELIATVMTIKETNKNPQDPTQPDCSTICDPALETCSESQPTLRPVKRTPWWWADIKIDERRTQNHEGTPYQPWNISALCQIGAFPQMKCTEAQKIESNCHPWASCAFDNIEYFCECPEDWTVFDSGFGPNGCQPPQVSCTAEEDEALCPSAAECRKILDVDNSAIDETVISYTDYVCCVDDECKPPSCLENEGSACHVLADCDRSDGVDNAKCVCPEGAFGTGYGAIGDGPQSGCNTNSWAVQITVYKPNITSDDLVIPTAGERRFFRSSWKLKQWYDDIRYDYRSKFARIYYNVSDGVSLKDGGVPDHFLTSMHHMVFKSPVLADEYYVTVNAFFETEGEAEQASQRMIDRLQKKDTELMGVKVTHRVLYNNNPTANDALIWGPKVYTWVLGTTSDELRVSPTGLNVLNVYWNQSCLASGCWVFDVEYAVGDNNWNVFYVPRANNDDSLSYDFDYTSSTLLSTFDPANFPCGSDQYDYNSPLPQEITACCIHDFEDNYRPAQSFVNLGYADSKCPGSVPETVTVDDMPGQHLTGTFDGMQSFVVHTKAVDPFVGRHEARFYMDEVELRTMASMLTGTVGVEHTLQTFVGMAEFKPTATKVIDMFTKQVDIYLENTNFFTVSTHGTNDYTFLEYVNLRLVEILDQDSDNTDDAATDDFVRTARGDVAQYVQVTFTLGSQYEVKNNGMDLIPSDSVRAGKGIFSSSANMFHRCDQYSSSEVPGADGVSNKFTEFEARRAQACAPDAQMCVSPSDIPDSFVSYNIPLGVDWLPAANPDLSENIFVSLVVQAQNADAIAGEVELSNITKTTLNAAIPVVAGGVNIFCDGVTAKTDLKDVANAVIIVGSAETADELTRLRIIGDQGELANSVLDPKSSTEINTDSIQSALMTIVVLGDDDFFGLGGTRRTASNFGIELEDAITIHIMESASGFDDEDSKAYKVRDLIETEGEELFDTSNSLQVDGYPLNAAFNIVIQRDQQSARLEPSDSLKQECSFAPPRPTGPAGSMPTTCVIRRDVSGRNNYPVQNGRAWPTAMELPHCGDATCTAGNVQPASTAGVNGGNDLTHRSKFMASILGDNDYADGLGIDFSNVIAKEYMLNDRYKRAWWINPGYEWTPTQTGNTALFQVSQKLLFFGLFNLNEDRSTDMSTRRRVLLSSATRRQGVVSKEEKETQSLSQVTLEFDQTPGKLLAQAVGVDEGNVATLTVTAELDTTEMCMPIDGLREELRTKLYDAVATASQTEVKAVSISKIVVTGADGCRRRSLSRKLFSGARAEIEMVVAFSTRSSMASFDMDSFKNNNFIIDAESGDLRDVKSQKNLSFENNDDEEEEGDKDNTVAIAVGVAAGVVVLGAMALLAFLFITRRNRELPAQAVAAPIKADPVGVWTDNNALSGMGPSTDGKLQAELAAANLARQNV